VKIKILLLGFGNVGRGFCELLSEKRELLMQRHGIHTSIIGISTRKRGSIYVPHGIDMETFLSRTTEDPLLDFKQIFPEMTVKGKDLSVEDLVSLADYDVLAECTVTSMDGGQPACGWIRNALERGKHVITTNKGPIAFHYPYLHELELKYGGRLLFEGTVMSGTPVFSTLSRGLPGSRIDSFEGVLNGTCNYILELMQQGIDYEKALQKAKECGYAEADPSMDVEGYDTALKALILSQVLNEVSLSMEKIELEGIKGINERFFKEACMGKGKIRLVARGILGHNSTDISVKPEVLQKDHPLYNLPGPMNGILFHSDTIGQVYISGRGAGSRETGFALLRDLISLFPGEGQKFKPINIRESEKLFRSDHRC